MNLMEETLLGYDVLEMDETTVHVLKRGWPRGADETAHAGAARRPTRQACHSLQLRADASGKVTWPLTEDFTGCLQIDGYSGYDAVGRRNGIVPVGCLANARRTFDEAFKAQKAMGRGGIAAEGLALIQKIYRVEKLARELGMSADARQRLRDEKARPMWGELLGWLDRVRRHAPPSTKIGEALGYLDNQWPPFIRVLDDGRIEVDNNACENAIRPFVMGRNAWLFSDALDDAEASARLPYAYLASDFTGLPKATTLIEIEALRPWALARPATRSVAAGSGTVEPEMTSSSSRAYPSRVVNDLEKCPPALPPGLPSGLPSRNAAPSHTPSPGTPAP